MPVNQLFFLSCSSCVQLLTDSIGQLLDCISGFSGKQEVRCFHLTRHGTHLSFLYLVHDFCVPVVEPKFYVILLVKQLSAVSESFQAYRGQRGTIPGMNRVAYLN